MFKNTEMTVKKPVSLRTTALLCTLMMAVSFIGNLPFSAFAEEMAQEQENITNETEAVQEYEADIQPEEPDIIIEDDARSEVTASYIPLDEEEAETAKEQLILSARQNMMILSSDSGNTFVADDPTEIVNNALKQFKLEYVFTSPEPYEGDTSSYIERDNNFVIKARLTINTEHEIEPGNMEFRLPGTLFLNRDSGYCQIKAVAVSKFNSIPNKSNSENQVYNPASVSANHQESVAPFNYYIDPDTGEYVFVNYDTLHSSSNMIEISFEKVEVFDVKDQTTWAIEPETHIIYNMEETGTLGEATDIYTHYRYTEEGTEIDLYQLMKTQSSGEKLFIYYDGDKNPKYIDKVVNGTHTWRKVHEGVNVEDFNANPTSFDYSDEFDMPVGTEPRVITNPYTLDKTGSGISGKVNTEVNLDTITKTPAPDTGKGYGAQLYTIGQMNRYIDTSNLSAKGVLNESGKLSDEYVYTCWSVNTKGTCTQPWTLLFEENPLESHLIKVSEAEDSNTPISTERFTDKDGVEWAYELNEEGEIKYTKVEGAKILGVTTIRPNGSFHYDSEIESNSSDISKMYQYVGADVLAEDNETEYNDFWYVADSNADMRNTFGLNDVATDKKFNVGYYVVVAYPKNEIDKYTAEEYGADVTHYAQLSNRVTAHLYSRDERQEQTSNRATDLPIMLSDYNWKGGGDSWYSNKSVDGDDKEGVLSVIDELRKTITTDPNTQQYLGNIVFHENYSAGYYNTCHKTSDDYSYNKGKYYQIVNVDDVMTALPYGYMTEDNALKEIYGKPFTLTGDDYFYSRAVLAISEQDIDPFEDEKLKLTSTHIDAYKSEFSLLEGATLADAYKAIDSGLKTNSVTDGLDWIVYGWFNGESDWRQIDLSQYRTDAVKAKISAEAAANPHITMEEYIACMDKDGKYQITMNFMDKNGMTGCPYRVKIVHNSVAYDTDAAFTLTTQLKVTSDKLSDTARHAGLMDENGTPLSASHPDLDSFRINLKNYSANTVTAYENYTQNPTKKINIWYDDTDSSKSSYRNYESNPYWSYINGNRYDFLTRNDMKKLYSSMTGNNYWHAALEDRTKSALGEALLGTDSASASLPSPYGISEYLPFDYIDVSLKGKTYSTLEEFLEDNRHIIRNIASIDISEMEKNSKAGKYASWENDTRNGQVLMTYTLYGYEGYKLSKELEPIIRDTHADDQPMRKTIVLCDLLPAGVNYYGSSTPVCGKLTTTNIGRTGYPVNEDDVNIFVDTWNTANANIIETKVFDNWEDGRTLVCFKVEYDEDKGIMNSNSWYIGCGVRFKAYVSWDNYTSAAEKDNIFAFVAADDYNEGNIYGRWTGGQDSQVYDDKGAVIPKTESNNPSMDYTPFKDKTDLDGDDYIGNGTEIKTINGKSVTLKEHNRMYGHANEMDTITMARTLGIKKSVKADADLYSDYENKDSVVAGKGYTYKIHIDKTEQGVASDLVIFDKLEAVTPSTWKGTFAGVDLDEVKSEFPNVKENPPTIWYSESLEAPTELYRIPKSNTPETDGYIYTFDKSETYTDDNKVTHQAEPAEWDFENANSVFDRTDKTFVEGDKNYEFTKHTINKNAEQINISRRWIKATMWTKTNADVHSIAIDFERNLVLKSDTAVVNVYIKMTAPAYDEDFKYTFNRSSFYFQDFNRSGTTITPAGTFEYSNSNITTVTIGQRRRVEVAKKIPLEASVSEELLEQAEFTFQVTNREFGAGAVDKDNPDNLTSVSEGDNNFANIGYDLYKEVTNGNTTTWQQVEKGVIHATDDNGEFKLKYGYKAVFDEISAYQPTEPKKDENGNVVKDAQGNVIYVNIQKYDFENYTVIEKSVPYWLGVKNLAVDNLDIQYQVSGYQLENFSIDSKTVTLYVMPAEHETGYECYYIEGAEHKPHNDSRGNNSTHEGYNELDIVGRFKLDYNISESTTLTNYTETRTTEYTDSLKEITVENFYRPVVYITKNPKGVPEGTTVDKTFTYKLRIYKLTDPKLGDVDGNKVQLTYDELTNDTYKILNKTIGTTTSSGTPVDSQNAYTDVREDGKIYWYKVDGSAGLYECPPGWNQDNDQANLYRDKDGVLQYSGVKIDEKGAYYEITFNTDITNTIALPIYIKHLTNGTEDGMLYQTETNEDGETVQVTYPRYSFSITEVNDNGSDWFCDTVEYGGTFGMGENAFEWTNTYKYKELLLTKNITHAPDSNTLANTSFTFRLTKDGNPYYYYKGDPSTASPVEWKLCTMDSEGNITAKTGEGTSGTVNTDGTFTVKGCGNDADESGDKIVIKLSYVSLGSSGSAAKYTITEILPERESSTDADTATTTEYFAVKESDTVQVKQNIPYSNLTIENDYLKRDITVKKVVASQTSSGTKKFEMVLCPVGLTAIPEVITGGTPTNTPKYGWKFELADGESLAFKEIGVVGDKFDLYEKYDSQFGLLTQEDENDTGTYRKVTTITLGSDDDFSTDVVNGTAGYIVLRKKYTGDTTAFGSELQTKNPVTFDLKLKDNSGVYQTVSGLTDEVQIISGQKFTTTENMTIKDGETCVVDLKTLSQKLTGSDTLCDFEIVETNWTKSKKFGTDWYVIEPENANATWEFENDTKQAIFTNVVTKFSLDNAIYKRIGYKDTEATKPTGIITFKVTDKDGEPVENVRCTAITSDDELIGYHAISDENGLIQIDFSDEVFSSEEGWKTEDGIRQYFLKLYFDRAVKINATADDALCITEVRAETDKSWGSLVGYEIYDDSATTVTGKSMKEDKNHWICANADTFVNVQETEQVIVQKIVNPTVDELSDEDKAEEFHYTLYQLMDSKAEPAPHISYKVYDINDTTMTTPKRTGTTDDTETGVFTLHHGEKAVLDLPKNAQWRITEDNSGRYKLVTDDSDVIKHDMSEGDKDHALYGDAGDDTDEAIAHKNPATGYTYEGYAIDTKTPPTTVTLYIVPDSENEDAGYRCYYINDSGNSVAVTDKVGAKKATYDSGDTIKQKFIKDFEISSADDVKEYYAISVDEIMYGFELNTTHDLENEEIDETIRFDCPVVLLRAIDYDSSHTDYDPGVRFYYYNDDKTTHNVDSTSGAVQYIADWYSTGYNTTYTTNSIGCGNPIVKMVKNGDDWEETVVNDDVTEIYAVNNDLTDGDKIWSKTGDESTSYLISGTSGNITIPRYVKMTHLSGKPTYHEIVAIGSECYGSMTDNNWRRNVNITSVTIPKTVKYIGAYAFRYTNLATVTYETDEGTGKSGVIQILSQAFNSTNVDVVLPNSVEFVGKEAYSKGKSDKNKTSGELILPASLYDLSEGAAHWEKFVGNTMCVMVGDGSSIPDMKTSFKYIKDSSSANLQYTFNVNEINGYQRNWVFGQNESDNGLTITNMHSIIGKNGGRIIVFPKGKLTLSPNCLNFDKTGQTGYLNYYLRVFQTESIDDLIVTGNICDPSHASKAKYVFIFTGLSKSDVENNADWTTKLNYIKSGATTDIKIYYKDDLTQANLNTILALNTIDDKTTINSIIAPDIKTWLNSLKVTSPLPKPPAPAKNSTNISQLLYIERKKLTIVTE